MSFSRDQCQIAFDLIDNQNSLAQMFDLHRTSIRIKQNKISNQNEGNDCSVCVVYCVDRQLPSANLRFLPEGFTWKIS